MQPKTSPASFFSLKDFPRHRCPPHLPTTLSTPRTTARRWCHHPHQVDAVDEKDLGQRFGVTGFPTLKYFPAGDEVEVEAYNEGRDLGSFVKFLNKKASKRVRVLRELNIVPRGRH